MKIHRTIKIWEQTLEKLRTLHAILDKDMIKIVDDVVTARLISVTEDPKVGDYALFTGWSGDSDRAYHINDRLCRIADIDDLSSAGDYPDRYTIEFISSGDEEECTRNCLAILR